MERKENEKEKKEKEKLKKDFEKERIEKERKGEVIKTYRGRDTSLARKTETIYQTLSRNGLQFGQQNLQSSVN